MTAGAPELAAPSLAGRRLGRYEVLTQLASGGMAAVYVARAQGVAGFERLVAIKILHPHLAHEEEFISMFLDEARLAARIRHPNVVATLDISDTHGAGYFLVMEYIEGDHLGALLRAAVNRGQRLPVPVSVRVLHDALGGLAAAHGLRGERGELLQLVHRDISPHNILVGVDGIARLTDFGVAKAEVRLSSTRDGQFKGKLSYMAPEHASTGQADQRSDLFSMGIVLWESLTGQRLFRAENNAATLNKILHEPIPNPSELLPELAGFDAVLGKALAREPDERFQSADEFMEALEEAAQEAGGTATTRKVGSVVKHLVGEKVAQDHERVRNSIESLGHSDLSEMLLPLPVEGSGSVSHVSMPRALEADAATRAARPGQLGADRRARRTARLAVAGVILLAIAAGAVLALMRSDPEESEGPDVVSAPAGGSPAGEAPAEGDEAAATPAAAEAAGSARGEAEAGATAEPAGPAGVEAAAAEADTATAEATGETEAEEPDEVGARRGTAAERRARARRVRRDRERTAGMRTSAMDEPEDDLLSNPYRR